MCIDKKEGSGVTFELLHATNKPVDYSRPDKISKQFFRPANLRPVFSAAQAFSTAIVQRQLQMDPPLNQEFCYRTSVVAS